MVSRDRHSEPGPLTVIGTHPVQYQAPVYAAVQRTFGVPVRAIYASDFSIAGGFDREFHRSVTWDNFVVDSDATIFLSTIRGKSEPGAPKISAAGLDGAIARMNPGAVLLTGYHPSFHLQAFYRVRRRHFPILFRAETTDHARQRSVLKTWLRDAMLRTVYQRCDRLLPIGQQSYNHYRRLGCPDSKLIWSPYCVDASVFQCDESFRQDLRSAKRRELGISDGQIAVMFSGKLGRHKGPHLLVEAVRRLSPEKRDRIVVVMVGSGPEQENLQQLAESEPRVQTVFAGFQNQSQLSPYYHSADLLVLPSYSETWGLVINEALHHGLPCVVTDAVGCAKDLIDVGVTGEIAKTADVDSLADAVERALRLIEDPVVRGRCREKIGAFTVERAAGGIANAYWSVTGNGVHH